MINDTVIKDYVEDYIINSGQYVALFNDIIVEDYDDCDWFPADDFIEAFEQA